MGTIRDLGLMCCAVGACDLSLVLADILFPYDPFLTGEGFVAVGAGTVIFLILGSLLLVWALEEKHKDEGAIAE